MYSTPAPTSFHALLAFIHTVKVKLVKEMDTPKAAVDHQAPVYDKDWLDQSLWEQPDLSTIRHWCMTRTDWSDQLLWEQSDLSIIGHCCMTRTRWSDQLLWEQPDWRYHWAVSCLISFQHNMLLSSDTQHLIAKKRSQHLLLSSDTAFDSHENHESHNDIPLPWQKLKADLISEAKTAPNTAHCVFFLVISDIIWWLIMYIIYIYLLFCVYHPNSNIILLVLYFCLFFITATASVCHSARQQWSSYTLK